MTLIDDLENSIDIVELVSRYTRLKKSGTSYKALCPFPGHSEKTPSFVISPSKQIAYCFGCHRGGGPLKFIMDMEQVEFREAVQILWNILGREVQGYTQSKETIEAKKTLYNLFQDAQRYYRSALWKHPEIQKYLFDRSIDEADIEKWNFWYSDSGIALYNFLEEKGYDAAQIQESQIFLDIKTKKDKFISRLIFPLQNNRGDIVAFAGRIIWSGEPKYLNSPASKLYDKSAILYGLYQARKSITEKNRAIIVEGYMDVIALHRAGFSETVGVSGTALTEKHIQMLARLSKKIYLCFDSDGAGKKATLSSLEMLKNKGLEVHIILLPQGKDPDEFLSSGGDFEAQIQNALSPIGFSLEQEGYNLESLDEKKQFLEYVLETIRSYADPIEQDMYLKELSLLSDTPKDILYDMLKKWSKPRPSVRVEVSPETLIQTPSQILSIISFLEEFPWQKEFFQSGIIFPEEIPDILKKYLSDPQKCISSLDLITRSHMEAFALDLENKYNSSGEQELYAGKLLKFLNTQSYKILSKTLKEKMLAGDPEAIAEYSHILGLAKKHHLK